MSCFGGWKKIASSKKTGIKWPTRPPKWNSQKSGERVVVITTLKDSVDPSQLSSSLIIAIDFGTTFTGVAYYHSSGTSPNAARDCLGNQIASNITVIRNWPNQGGQYVEKTPTVIAYNTNPPTWGGSVKSRQDMKIVKFKLGLEPHLERHYDMDETMKFSSPVGLYKRPVDITADFLTCVMRYVHEACFPFQFGADFLRNQQLAYIITVPAIWSDLAKDLTRQAAVRAGIAEDRLDLVTEPEAAALYCATTCEEVDMDDGDRFLVCDAGGGTVVRNNFDAN
jgi:molecular chaperone DnaK (HSP70)